METISDEILNTIKYALEKLEVKCDKTFTSIIKHVNSNSTYIINDLTGVDRTVKCCIPNLDLKVGQSVYVKIPSGNLKKMHICGIVK